MILGFVCGLLCCLVIGGVGLVMFLRSRKNTSSSSSDAINPIADLQAQTQAQLKMQSELNQQLSQDLSQQMSLRFEAMATRFFEEKAAKLSDQNVKDLGTLLEPFKERLKDFEKKVEEAYATERSERGSLRGELSKLMELNLRMSSEAENLTKALKGDNKTMGNWGEMILENILERSGLRKGEEYVIQGTDLALRNNDGQVIRPDVIVNLPDNKHIIVDSKVSLLAYENYSQAETTEQREAAAKLHVESLKRHIDGLSAKKYSSSEQLSTPDFVILFMPIEPAFALAFKYKPDLLQYAWDKNVALVSPTTLLTTLRTVAAIWKQDRQEKNALEIARRGGQLYDKFASLVEDLEDLGKKIEATQKSHGHVMSKLNEGTGNLIRQVEMLRELGAKAEKKLVTRNHEN
jgi:DNA recombination protein RmuC